MDKDNLINPILKPENDQSNWKQWQKDLPNQFLNMDNSKKDDPVNHPSHYTDGKIEVIDFIEDKKLGFHLGNAVKYISRAGKKDPGKEIEDLEKAVWYVNRRIELLKKQQETVLTYHGYPVDPNIIPCKKEA